MRIEINDEELERIIQRMKSTYRDETASIVCLLADAIGEIDIPADPLVKALRWVESNCRVLASDLADAEDERERAERDLKDAQEEIEAFESQADLLGTLLSRAREASNALRCKLEGVGVMPLDEDRIAELPSVLDRIVSELNN